MIVALVRRWWWLVAGMALLFAPAQMARDGELGSPAQPDAREVTAAALAPTVSAGTAPAPQIALSRLVPRPSQAALVPAAIALITLTLAPFSRLAGPATWVESVVPRRRHAHRGPPAPRLR